MSFCNVIMFSDHGHAIVSIRIKAFSMSGGSEITVPWSAGSSQRIVLISCAAKSVFLNKIKP